MTNWKLCSTDGTRRMVAMASLYLLQRRSGESAGQAMKMNATNMHSLDERIFPGRTKWSCPVDILTTSVALGSSNIEGSGQYSHNGSQTGTGLTPNLADHYEFPERSAQRRNDVMRVYRQLRKIFMAGGVKEIKRPRISYVTFYSNLSWRA